MIFCHIFIKNNIFPPKIRYLKSYTINIFIWLKMQIFC